MINEETIHLSIKRRLETSLSSSSALELEGSGRQLSPVPTVPV